MFYVATLRNVTESHRINFHHMLTETDVLILVSVISIKYCTIYIKFIISFSNPNHFMSFSLTVYGNEAKLHIFEYSVRIKWRNCNELL